LGHVPAYREQTELGTPSKGLKSLYESYFRMASNELLRRPAPDERMYEQY
jgi:hypothetical protein